MSDANGQSLSSITYYPFGETRTGSVPTDRKFTGQREDGTGLYYYNARYYDPEIGRFISADTAIQDLNKTQSFNRYSYTMNNPLKYTDPTGNACVSDDGSGSGSESVAHTYTVVWGYIESVPIIPPLSYIHTVIVVVDENGNYYKIESQSVGAGVGTGLTLYFIPPGSTIGADNIEDPGTYEITINSSFSLVSDKLGKLWNVAAGFDSNGNWVWEPGTDIYFVVYFATPDIISGHLTHTSVTSLTKEEVYDLDPPGYFTKIYRNWFGVDIEGDDYLE